MRRDVAVVVGRFQVPYLHPGHKFILNYALAHHDRVLVVIGCSPLPLSRRNPLDFETRSMMISRYFPDVVIARIEDNRSDEIWSARLDEIIEGYFPSTNAVLYGSRDCFFEHYKGKHRTELVEAQSDRNGQEYNATEMREAVGALGSPDFRVGMIYASKLPFPTSYQVVDTAIIRDSDQSVLLGHKIGDGEKFRFVGGFVDPTDPSLERAAKRETLEEVGSIETDCYKYLGSARIADWRYRGGLDGVMSAFFVAKYIYGRPQASDDLNALAWVPLSELEGKVIDEHLPLVEMLKEYLGQTLAKSAR
ncbi:NUDIX domain-containing protein [bacterium]|nr:MAG: NUDIX domain-containing protein [bacterium]